MGQKSFQDLINEVHEKGICQECGGCVSFCTSVDYDVIGFKKPDTPPEYIIEDQCLECGICYYLCPQTHAADEELGKSFNFSNFLLNPIGNVEKIHSCQATDKEFLEHGTDGGVVNSIINYLIEKRIVDGAIVAKIKGPFSREAMFTDSKDGLINASGTKLDISSQLGELQKFSTYTRSIPELNHYKFKKLAIVGTPCQIYTVRCMQELGVTPSENIEICLGLFCYENFLFDQIQIQRFEKDFNLKFNNIKKLNIKEDLIITLKDDGTGERKMHIPFSHLAEYIRPACNVCNDFTNVYSDISFGGLGSPNKYTTVIPRTERGKEIFKKVLYDGKIKCLELGDDKRNQMTQLISQISHAKIKRSIDFLKKLKK
ncbi:MAG: hypothetical protein EU548_00765 [Promethearchaeota archaeon]|nr:MAG: hypothetical protein EU548_00765 [Candidatus Lokiarchaeota archaeon]